MSNTAEIINLFEQDLPENQPEVKQEGVRYVKAHTKNGFLKEASLICEMLCITDFNERQQKIFSAIKRKTWGFNKSVDWISNEQLAEMTKIHKSHVSEVKSSLVNRNILIKRGNKIGINPVVSEWITFNPKKRINTTNTKTLNRVLKNPTEDMKNPTEGITVPSVSNHNRKDNITIDKNNNISALTPVVEPEKPKATRIKKPQAFKNFYSLYPAHRRGGTDSTPWGAWKSEELTEQDALIAISWLNQAAKSDPQWQTNANGQYVKGITKFIREKHWLTPIPVSHVSKNQPLDMDDISWANNLDEVL